MPAGERKRPWYLVVALLGAFAFGASGANDGWATVARYREAVDPSLAGQGIADEADRAAVIQRFDAYLHAFDAAKARGWPLGIATLLLGGATLFFAMRAMAGSGSARVLLVQLVLAQSGVSLATHWLLYDVERAELRWVEAAQAARIHETVPEGPRAEEFSRAVGGVMNAATSIALGLELAGSALIVVGLTRRRSRDFFDATRAAVGER